MFLGRFNRRRETQPVCRWKHPRDWGPQLNESGELNTPFISLCFQTMDACSHGFPTVVDYILTCEPKSTHPSTNSVCLVFCHSRKENSSRRWFCYNCCYCFGLYVLALEMEPRASQMSGKHPTTEPYPQHEGLILRDEN